MLSYIQFRCLFGRVYEVGMHRDTSICTKKESYKNDFYSLKGSVDMSEKVALLLFFSSQSDIS